MSKRICSTTRRTSNSLHSSHKSVVSIGELLYLDVTGEDVDPASLVVKRKVANITFFSFCSEPEVRQQHHFPCSLFPGPLQFPRTKHNCHLLLNNWVIVAILTHPPVQLCRTVCASSDVPTLLALEPRLGISEVLPSLECYPPRDRKEPLYHSQWQHTAGPVTWTLRRTVARRFCCGNASKSFLPVVTHFGMRRRHNRLIQWVLLVHRRTIAEDAIWPVE